MRKHHIQRTNPRSRRPHSTTPPQDQKPLANPPSAAFEEEDPKRRLGGYTGTAEHARQQPGPRNDGGRRHGEDAS